MRFFTIRLLTPLGALLALVGCDLIGPSCVDRRETGSVTAFSGGIGAGAIASHLVPYATQGSQNNAELSWLDQSSPTGPRLKFYATRASCENFDPAAIPDSGPCATLARAGWFDGRIASTLTITNGRGNPDVLGTPAGTKSGSSETPRCQRSTT